MSRRRSTNTRSVSPEMRALIAACVSDGWDLSRTKKGFKLSCAGGMFFAHCTLSDRRAVRNARAEIHKISGKRYV